MAHDPRRGHGLVAGRRRQLGRDRPDERRVPQARPDRRADPRGGVDRRPAPPHHRHRGPPGRRPRAAPMLATATGVYVAADEARKRRAHASAIGFVAPEADARDDAMARSDRAPAPAQRDRRPAPSRSSPPAATRPSALGAALAELQSTTRTPSPHALRDGLRGARPIRSTSPASTSSPRASGPSTASAGR